MAPATLGMLSVEIEYIKKALDKAELARDEQKKSTDHLYQALEQHMRDETEVTKALITKMDEKFAPKSEVVFKSQCKNCPESPLFKKKEDTTWIYRVSTKEFWGEKLGLLIIGVTFLVS